MIYLNYCEYVGVPVKSTWALGRPSTCPLPNVKDNKASIN